MNELETLEPLTPDDISLDSRFHAVYTISLNELIENGIFDWSKPYLQWSGLEESDKERIQKAFSSRFLWREVSCTPLKKWFSNLVHKLTYELAPKYAILYKELEEVPLFSNMSEYEKTREVGSTYPETLLSNTSQAYASEGRDFEREKYVNGDIFEKMAMVKDLQTLDTMFLDELEVMFVDLYTATIGGF